MLDYLQNLIGILTGFVSGWGLFELTELRRRRIAQRNLRRLVRAELQQTELTMSNLVCLFGAEFRDTERFIQEMRWAAQHLPQMARFSGAPLPDDVLMSISKRTGDRSDEELRAFLGCMPGTRQTCIEIPLPVIRSTLATPTTSGFGDEELERLSALVLQFDLLTLEAKRVHDLFPLTFTVSDPENHAIVTENLRQSRQSYYRRLVVALDTVRATSRALVDP